MVGATRSAARSKDTTLADPPIVAAQWVAPSTVTIPAASSHLAPPGIETGDSRPGRVLLLPADGEDVDGIELADPVEAARDVHHLVLSGERVAADPVRLGPADLVPGAGKLPDELRGPGQRRDRHRLAGDRVGQGDRASSSHTQRMPLLVPTRASPLRGLVQSSLGDGEAEQGSTMETAVELGYQRRALGRLCISGVRWVTTSCHRRQTRRDRRRALGGRRRTISSTTSAGR